MNIKKLLTTITLLLVCTLAACQMPPPIIDTTEPIERPTESPNSPPPPAEEMPEVLGCAEGGIGVFTPEDLQCYLDGFEDHLVHEVNDEVTLLVLPSGSGAAWIGGASLYHIPTVSSITLDVHGYVDPAFTSINTWHGRSRVAHRPL